MRSIEALDFKHLKEGYKLLVPEEYHSILEGRPPLYHPLSTQTFGFGELENGVPAGILLGSAIPGHSDSIIHYLYGPHVEDLLDRVDGTLKLYYWEENRYAEEIAAACRKRGWKGPELNCERYLIEIQRLHPAWLEKSYTYSKGFVPFPWGELPNKEIEPIRRRASFASSPFDWPNPSEPVNSLGLSYQGETVGWMVTHRIHPEIIRYTVLYTYPEYRFKGEIIKLLIDSIKKHQRSDVPYAQFDLFSFGVDYRWKEFIKKRLAPYAKRISKEFVFWTQLP